jgi:putative nucleotidyltransferase with HDIG domain
MIVNPDRLTAAVDSSAHSAPALEPDPAIAEARARALCWAWVLLGAITVLHVLLGARGTGLRHAVHVGLAALYLAPIVLAAKARGARTGASFAGAASLLYLAHVALRDPVPWPSLVDELAVVAGFVTVGVLVGSLTADAERRRDERDRVLLAANRSEVRSALDGLVAALGARDPALAEHSRRVADLADLVAHELGLDRSQRAAAHLAGLLHDVGKIGLGDDILHSDRRLSPEQRARIHDHPRLAADLVRSVGGDDELVDAVHAHHESPDGSGYPRGLRDAEIPLLARILKVADVFVAITEERHYRPAALPDGALEELRAMAPDRVDPAALAALEGVVAKGWWPPGHFGRHSEPTAATSELAIVAAKGERHEAR